MNNVFSRSDVARILCKTRPANLGGNNHTQWYRIVQAFMKAIEELSCRPETSDRFFRTCIEQHESK